MLRIYIKGYVLIILFLILNFGLCCAMQIILFLYQKHTYSHLYGIENKCLKKGSKWVLLSSYKCTTYKAYTYENWYVCFTYYTHTPIAQAHISAGKRKLAIFNITYEMVLSKTINRQPENCHERIKCLCVPCQVAHTYKYLMCRY